MSQDGKEAAALLIRIRLDDLQEFLRTKANWTSPGFKAQAEIKWDKITEAYVYYQNGSIP